MPQPLILTLQLDDNSHAFYEGLRRRYFPPERNLIAAHLTLFHQLPDEDRTYQTVCEAAQATESFLLTHPALRSIGKGVAVFFQSERLCALHAELLTAFQAPISAQDRQRLQPHIVIQNKVAPEVARHTVAQLQATSFMEPIAIGLSLSRYLGGPWQHLSDFPFPTSPTP